MSIAYSSVLPERFIRVGDVVHVVYNIEFDEATDDRPSQYKYEYIEVPFFDQFDQLTDADRLNLYAIAVEKGISKVYPLGEQMSILRRYSSAYDPKGQYAQFNEYCESVKASMRLIFSVTKNQPATCEIFAWQGRRWLRSNNYLETVEAAVAAIPDPGIRDLALMSITSLNAVWKISDPIVLSLMADVLSLTPEQTQAAFNEAGAYAWIPE